MTYKISKFNDLQKFQNFMTYKNFKISKLIYGYKNLKISWTYKNFKISKFHDLQKFQNLNMDTKI